MHPEIGTKPEGPHFAAMARMVFLFFQSGHEASKNKKYQISRAAKRGVFPIWTCPSFFVLFVLFGTFPIFLGFSRFARGWSGDFPDLSFSSFSAY